MKKIDAWVDNNGKGFFTKEECAKSDGLVKCRLCSGTGEEVYTEKVPYPRGLPDSDYFEFHTVNKIRTCKRCEGIGYVKMNIEDDPEYNEFLKLKKKFLG